MKLVSSNQLYFYEFSIILYYISDEHDILFPDTQPKSNTNSNQRQLTSQFNPNVQQNPQNYIATNVVPMGATHYKNRIFITAPRRRPGIPSTLNFVHTKSTKGSSPSFKAFPNDEINELHVNEFH